MMDTSSNRPISHSDRSLWLPLVLVGLALVLRAVKSTAVGADWLPNFSPWMALAFAGTALFPRQFSGWWVLGLLIIVDGLFQSSVWLSYPLTLAAVYACFALAAAAAMRVRGSIGAGGVILGVLGCSVGFYLVTNSLSWWLSPEYVKSASGWLQALTVGLPGFPPTWTFLRNSLLSDLGFTAMLILAHNVEASAKAMPRLGWSIDSGTCAAEG